jgi:cytochrome c553
MFKKRDRRKLMINNSIGIETGQRTKTLSDKRQSMYSNRVLTMCVDCHEHMDEKLASTVFEFPGPVGKNTEKSETIVHSLHPPKKSGF